MPNLQSLFCAILDESKFLTRIQFWVHVCTFLAAASTIFLIGVQLYVACLMAGITEIVAWFLKMSAESKKELGQEILRANMLQEAFGRHSGISITYLSSRIPKSVRNKAGKHINDEYYTSLEKKDGKNRLVKILQESCFWSHNLYQKCAKSSFVKSVLFLFIVFFIGISYSVFSEPDQAFSGPRIFVLLIVLVPLWSQVGDSITWYSSSIRLKEVDHRLETVSVEQEAEIFALYADYNVITSKAPLVPQKVYESEKQVLNELWEDRNKVT